MGWEQLLERHGVRPFLSGPQGTVKTFFLDEQTGEVITNAIKGAWKHTKDHF